MRRETTRGSADRLPARIGHAVLHVSRSGRKLYELAYDFQSDALLSPDLSVFATHLMETALTETAFQADPWSILWAAREDGALLGLTYLTEQQVSGWHRHGLGGGGRCVRSRSFQARRRTRCGWWWSAASAARPGISWK